METAGATRVKINVIVNRTVVPGRTVKRVAPTESITIVTAIATAATRIVTPTRVAAANRKADPAIPTTNAAP